MLLKKFLTSVSLLIALSYTTMNARTIIDKTAMNQVFYKHNAKGSILVLDYKSKEYITNDSARVNIGFIPASTFKIPNTLIALECNIITTDSVFHWDGQPRYLKAWEADMNIRSAYDVSCVPVYQGIARSVGIERMQEYVKRLDFGDMDIAADNLDSFWLEGQSMITQYQQVYFLTRLYDEVLPLRKETMRTVKDIMIREHNENYTLRAKTGWGQHLGADVGWYVGYLETKDNVYFFATNIEPLHDGDVALFSEARVAITKQILSDIVGLRVD